MTWLKVRIRRLWRGVKVIHLSWSTRNGNVGGESYTRFHPSAVYELGLIRFGGHLPKGGYDVDHGGHEGEDERDAASLRSSRRAPCGWSSMRARRSPRAARDLGLTESSLRNWVEHARADRTQGQDGPDDGGARGAGAAPERELRIAPGGARHPEKSGGLLREAEPMRFTFIAAKKAEHTVTHSLSLSARDAQRLLRLAASSGIDACPGRSPAEGAGAGVVRREQAALRQPAHPRGSARAAGARQPQARHPIDAGRRPEGAGAASATR